MTHKRSIGCQEVKNLTIMGGMGCRKAQDSSTWNFSKITDEAMANLDTSYCCMKPASIDSDRSKIGSMMSKVSHGSDDDLEGTIDDDCMEVATDKDSKCTIDGGLHGR
jgi:hypothetical protein